MTDDDKGLGNDLSVLFSAITYPPLLQSVVELSINVGTEPMRPRRNWLAIGTTGVAVLAAVVALVGLGLIPLAMLSLGGLRPPLPGRS